jgi:hypothetical protein
MQIDAMVYRVCLGRQLGLGICVTIFSMKQYEHGLAAVEGTPLLQTGLT